MAVEKNTNDLLAQAAANLPDNTTQDISPADVREMAENTAVSSFNKITDAALVGLKEYSTLVTYESGQGCVSSGKVYISNKITGPGAFVPADWDIYDNLTAADKAKIDFLTITQAVDLDTMESDVATNNGKITNASHTGEVTGSGALTVNPTAISNKTALGVLAGTEELLINDGGTLKKVLASNLGGSNLYTADGTLTGVRTVTMGNNDLQFLSDGSGTFKVDSNGNSGSVNFYEYRGSLATSAKLIQTQKERGDWSIGTDLLAANAPNLNWNGSGTLSANVTQNGIKNFRGLYNGAETFSVRNDGNIIAGINAAGTSYLNFTSTLGLYLKGAINSAQPILRGADQNGNVVFRLNNSGSLAVGLSTPTAKLHVKGAGSTSGTTALLVQNSLSSNLLEVLDDGKTGINAPTPLWALHVKGINGDANIAEFQTWQGVPIMAVVGTGVAVNSATMLGGDPTTKLSVGGKIYCTNDIQGTKFYAGAEIAGVTANFEGGTTASLRINGNFHQDSGPSGYAYFKNLSVGTGAAPTSKLQVKGTGSTSGTTALLVQNSLSTNLLEVKDDGSAAFNGNLGLFGTTPIAQPTTAGGSALLSTGAGTGLTDLDTFDGYTLQQVVKALRNLGILA